MALEGRIGGSDLSLFVGEDKTLTLHVKDEDEVPVNISGWAISFVVKRHLSDALSAAVINETATISGSYNVDPDVNTQRASVTLTDTDMALDAVNHYYSWKRTDDGFETVLRHGLFVPVKASQL